LVLVQEQNGPFSVLRPGVSILLSFYVTYSSSSTSSQLSAGFVSDSTSISWSQALSQSSSALSFFANALGTTFGEARDKTVYLQTTYGLFNVWPITLGRLQRLTTLSLLIQDIMNADSYSNSNSNSNGNGGNRRRLLQANSQEFATFKIRNSIQIQEAMNAVPDSIYVYLGTEDINVGPPNVDGLSAIDEDQCKF